ncbi:MAG: PAS domain S-box protein [Magnetovibrio sp.]|nr:PAS domain S-box protein [Magnetovibrio sp.]
MVIFAIAVMVLIFDLSMPLGVAGAVPYVILVMAGFGLRNHYSIYALAVLATALTIGGYLASPSGGVEWIVLTNRGLAIFAIWVTAFLTVSHKLIERRNRIMSHAVEQSDDLVFITDTNGIIKYINSQFTKVTGFTAQDAIGKTPRIIKSDHTPPKFYEKMWSDILCGKTWRGEIQDRTKDGKLFWASAQISPIHDKYGNITHFVAMHEDITLRKEALAQILEAKAEADVANRTKSEFMANMSHELRTPLNAIIGFSHMLDSDIFGSTLQDKQREYAHDIQVSGEHLLELINDILDVSAIEADSLTIHEESVDFNKVASSALRMIKPRAEKGQIDLINEVALTPLHLRADERRLKQVLLNLLSNAVKFTPAGGCVTLSSERDANGALLIHVSDTGIGMNDAELTKALTQFGQVDSTLSRKHEGAGLGLTLATGLAEVQGGKLVLTSEKGKGTRATVTFPAQRILPPN